MDAPRPLPTAADVEGLRRLARGLLGRGDLAEDAVQDAWVVARERGGPGGIPWLGGIVRNRARQILRSETRRRRREEGVPGTGGPDDPVDHVAAIEQQRVALEELQRLPEPFRIALWLRFLAGRTPEQAAAEQGVAIATERTRVHRALAMLRERLDARDRGGRRGWCLALAPFAFPRPLRAPSGGSAAHGVPGVALLASAVVAVVVALVLVTGVSRAPVEGTRAWTPERAPGEAPRLAGRADGPSGPTLPGEALPLRVRVHLPGGGPAAGARVYAHRKARPVGDAAWPVALRQAGSDGAVEILVPDPASHVVLVAPEAGTEAAVLVFDGADLLGLRGGERATWRLPPARRIDVEVAVPSGVSPDAVRIRLLAGEPDLAVPWPGAQEPFLGLDAIRTVGPARFEVVLPDGLPRLLRATAPGCGTRDVRLVGDGAVHVELARSATLRVGSALGDGSLPPGTLATLAPRGVAADGLLAPGRLVDGALVFDEGLAAGPHRLRVAAPRHRPAWLDVFLPEAGAVVETRVALEPCGPEGRLRLVGGVPRAAGATETTDGRGLLLLRALRPDGAPWELRRATVEPDGSLRLQGLPPGAHDVIVVDGRRPAVARTPAAEVPSDAEADIALDLADAIFLRMPSVRDAPRVRGASVRLADGSAWPLFRWDAAGARLAEGFDLPLPGARVGPYPRRHAAPTLVLERDEGEQRIPLLPDDELPAPGVPR